MKLKKEGPTMEQESVADLEKVGQVDLKSARPTSPLSEKAGQVGMEAG